MKGKRKTNGIQIFKIIVGIFLITISLTGTINTAFELSVNKERISRSAEMAKQEVVGKEIPAKPKMENPEPYNSMNTRGYASSRNYSDGAMAFYRTTGIQLYFIDFDFGYEEFETEADLRNRIKDEILQLDNINNSMVMYSYTTDHDYKSKYYYSGYDEVYYGDNVTKYLSSDDLQMINFYKQNAYDLWDYDTRDSQVWITAGDMLANGYNTADYQNIKLESYNEIDAGILSYLTFALIIYLVILVSGLLLVITGFRRIRKNSKYNDSLDKAEIDYYEAKVTREILEADINELVTEEEKDLMSTYYEDEYN